MSNSSADRFDVIMAYWQIIFRVFLLAQVFREKMTVLHWNTYSRGRQVYKIVRDVHNTIVHPIVKSKMSFHQNVIIINWSFKNLIHNIDIVNYWRFIKYKKKSLKRTLFICLFVSWSALSSNIYGVFKHRNNPLFGTHVYV